MFGLGVIAQGKPYHKYKLTSSYYKRYNSFASIFISASEMLFCDITKNPTIDRLLKQKKRRKVQGNFVGQNAKKKSLDKKESHELYGFSQRVCA